MSVGFNLKYGEGYEDLPHWDQFVQVLECAKGRKNMFIFRVITALINELDLNGADSFQTLNAIEYWASERLSGKATAKNRSSIPGKSPPSSNPVNTSPVSTVSVSPEKESVEVSSNLSKSVYEESMPAQTTNGYLGYDTSVFKATKNNSANS